MSLHNENNPFLKSGTKGEFKNFYYSQFDNIKHGVDFAEIVNVHEKGNIRQARRYASWYAEDKDLKVRTKLQDGCLWVAILEVE